MRGAPGNRCHYLDLHKNSWQHRHHSTHNQRSDPATGRHYKRSLLLESESKGLLEKQGMKNCESFCLLVPRPRAEEKVRGRESSDSPGSALGIGERGWVERSRRRHPGLLRQAIRRGHRIERVQRTRRAQPVGPHGYVQVDLRGGAEERGGRSETASRTAARRERSAGALKPQMSS